MRALSSTPSWPTRARPAPWCCRCSWDSSQLYRGLRLAAAREATRVWSADPVRYPALTAAEAEFLRASGRASTRGRWGRRTLAGALVLALAAALAGAGLAVRSARNDASQQRTANLSERLAAQSTALEAADPVTAALLAGAAWRIAPTAQARYSLRESLAQPVRGLLAAPSGTVTAVAYSPGGMRLAAAYRDGTIRLWDIASHRLLSTATWGGAALALAFTGGGKALEVAGPAAVGTWNLTGQAKIAVRALAGLTGGRCVAFSPDGATLATGGGDGNVRLWDVATQQEIGAPMSSDLEPVEAVTFSPDGATVAAASSDGTVQLWDATTKQEAGTTMAAGPAAVRALAFSPAGKFLAAGGDDGNVRLWDTATHSQAGATMATGAPVVAVSFSANGTTLATAGSDDGTELWAFATQEQTGTALGSGRVSALAFNPDADVLATGAGNGTIELWLWQVATQQETGVAVTTGPGQGALAFSPDGKTLATIGANGTAALWSLTTKRRIGALMNAGASVAQAAGARATAAVAFSPDGTTLATASAGGSSSGGTRLWDVATQQELGTPMTAGPEPVYALAFSPDGTTLITASAGGSSSGSARLWNVAFPAGLLAAACAIADRSLTREQWADYAGTQPFQQVCPAS